MSESGESSILSHSYNPAVVSHVELNGVRVGESGINALVADVGREVLGENNVVPLEAPSMGAEDFAAYLRYAPGAMFRIGGSFGRGRLDAWTRARWFLASHWLALPPVLLAGAVVLASRGRRFLARRMRARLALGEPA